MLLSAPTAVPNEIVIDECLTFLLAGADTVAATTQWTLYFLAKYPDVQEKLRAEILEHTGTSGITEDLDVNKMTYMRHVIQESLRLRTPTPGIHRVAAEDCVLAGIAIPKGTDLLMMYHVTHTDERYWNEPLKFMPERFEEPVKHPYAFIPFLAGQRFVHIFWRENLRILEIV